MPHTRLVYIADHEADMIGLMARPGIGHVGRLADSLSPLSCTRKGGEVVLEPVASTPGLAGDECGIIACLFLRKCKGGSPNDRTAAPGVPSAMGGVMDRP